MIIRMSIGGGSSCLENTSTHTHTQKWNNSLWTQTSQDPFAKSEEQPDCDHFSQKCFITDYDLTDGSSSRFSEAMTQRTFPAMEELLGPMESLKVRQSSAQHCKRSS